MNKSSLIKRGIFTALVFLSVLAHTGCSGEEDAPLVRLSETAVNVGWDAYSVPVDVLSNSQWTVSSNAAWCRPSVSSGRNSCSINIIIDESNENSLRTAVVTFKTAGRDSDTATIIVSQAGEDHWNSND